MNHKILTKLCEITHIIKNKVKSAPIPPNSISLGEVKN